MTRQHLAGIGAGALLVCIVVLHVVATPEAVSMAEKLYGMLAMAGTALAAEVVVDKRRVGKGRESETPK